MPAATDAAELVRLHKAARNAVAQAILACERERAFRAALAEAPPAYQQKVADYLTDMGHDTAKIGSEASERNVERIAMRTRFPVLAKQMDGEMSA